MLQRSTPVGVFVTPPLEWPTLKMTKGRDVILNLWLFGCEVEVGEGWKFCGWAVLGKSCWSKWEGRGDTLGGSQSHVLEWGRGSSTTSLGWWLTPAIGSGREQQGVGAAPLWENCVIHLVHNCVQSFWSEPYSVSCVHLLRSRAHCNRCDRQPCVKLLSSEVFFVLCTLQLCETVVI